MAMRWFDVIFTSPVAGELEYRRQSLNRAGYQAYIIPALILLGSYLLRTAFKSRTSSSKASADNLLPNAPTTLQKRLRRLHWDLTTTHIPEYGPLYIQVLAAFHILAIAYIIVVPTIGKPNVYMHITKAFGHVAISQIPWLYLLSVKSPYSPVQLATGLTHERLNAVHRLFGTIIYSMLACHAVLYLNFFIVKGFLTKRLGDLDVRTGLSAFTLLNVLFIAALPVIRKKLYHAAFYRVHVFVSAAVPILIWFHVPYTRIYIVQAALIWVLSGISRRGAGNLGWSEIASVRCETVGPGLIKVTCRLVPSALSKWQDNWVPGMHGYLDQGLLGPKNPFTVVSVKTEKHAEIVEIVARDLGGPTTNKLAQAAKSEKTLTMRLEGPYGEAKEYMPSLLNCSNDKVMIVAGGVGATYALPIYLSLLEARGGSDKKLKFVWFVKNKSDAEWGVQLLQQSQMNTNFNLVTTRDEGRNIKLMSGNKAGLKSIDRPIRARSRDLEFLIDELVHDFLHAAPTDRASVMVCGPPGLAQKLRSPFGRHLLYNGTKINWYEEQFGFGGT